MADNKKTAARSVRGGGLDEKKPALKSRLFECGRRERIRTSDPLVPNQLRYQAALLAESERMLLPLVQSVNAFF